MSLRLLLDENAESKWLANRLKQAGHDVLCIKDLTAKGSTDEQVLQLAIEHNRILYTRDRDFLELSKSLSHNGIILEFVTETPRDLTVQQIIDALAAIEEQYTDYCGQLIIANSLRRSV